MTAKAEKDAKPQLASLSFDALQGEMEALGQPAYRAGQLFGWLHAKGADRFDEMTNLPAALREELAARYTLGLPGVESAQYSADGTVKALVAMEDESRVEMVLMRYRHGHSLCVSTQAGCRMGCRFCASSVQQPGGLAPGLVRNLTAGEMAGQVYAAEKLMKAGHPDGGSARVGHLVLMGIGEALDNYDNVLSFLSLITHEKGHGLSARNISLSTCGVVPGIYRLAKEKLQLTLSVSLHAADDETRSRLMPVNDAWPLDVLMKACRDYQKTTGRRISYEYALFRGVNDSAEDAGRLAKLLAGSGAHLNLIAANAVPNSGFEATSPAAMDAFAARLRRAGINTTQRRRLGADIDAACGQLRMGAKH